MQRSDETATVGDRLAQLELLNALAEILNREAEFERALPHALDSLVTLMGLSTGWVFLSNTSQGDSHQGTFSLAAAIGLPPALDRDGRRVLCTGNCECQGLFRRGRLDRGVNMVTCSRLAGAAGDRGGLELHASVPLIGAAGPVGILNLAAPGETRLDEATLLFLGAVGKQLGMALERYRLQEQRTREARYTAALEERERMARQLHDSIAQLLFAADLSLQVALQEGQKEEGRVDDRSAVERAADAVAGALEDLRALVEVQRPADLNSGLLPALARLAERTGSGAVTVHLDSQLADVDGPVAEGLYRVAQEGVGNALRHSRCSNIWIRLRREGETVRLEVEDDGHGFDVESARQGLGIPGMTERMRTLGGHLSLESDAEGTRLAAEVPWPLA